MPLAQFLGDVVDAATVRPELFVDVVQAMHQTADRLIHAL